jgi:hypothetical protein
MEGLGIFVCIAFILLMLTILFQSCAPTPAPVPGIDGFADVKPMQPVQPVQLKPVPPKPAAEPNQSLLTQTSDLPSAPIVGLAETNSRPFEDPALEKSPVGDLKRLKAEMDGFVANELPILQGRSDPAITLRISQFRGDYERVKDEVAGLTRSPGLQSTVTREDMDGYGANLRTLQRQARLFTVNGMEASTDVEEGFEVADAPITPEQLTKVSKKLTAEINRLQASGTSNPVNAKRVAIFTQIRQTVDDYDTAVKSGNMEAKNIPIKNSDYKNFLPVLGTSLENKIPTLISVNAKTEPGMLVSESFEARGSPRGEFEAIVQSMRNTGSGSTKTAGHFDWERRASEITENIKRAGMNTADFGCFEPGKAVVGPDYSWRGHTKMICTRLAANVDPAIPEQMGCPPVSWKGWRL